MVAPEVVWGGDHPGAMVRITSLWRGLNHTETFTKNLGYTTYYGKQQSKALYIQYQVFIRSQDVERSRKTFLVARNTLTVWAPIIQKSSEELRTSYIDRTKTLLRVSQTSSEIVKTFKGVGRHSETITKNQDTNIQHIMYIVDSTSKTHTLKYVVHLT